MPLQPASPALRCPPLATVRLGLIGVGNRGGSLLGEILKIEGSRVKGICDARVDLAEKRAATVVEKGFEAPDVYESADLDELLDREDIDVVLIATPWDSHTPMAVRAMRAGKHALIEVPAALTVDECWQLVDTAESTQRHCMMLENVCYGRDELMILNMVRQGVFGEIVHGEAAYFHDLRGQMHDDEVGTGSWRTLEYMRRNGNLYPTHGLGPISQYMNLNRGDRMDYLCSISSSPHVRAEYAAQNFGESHKWRSKEFVCGDINTTILRTVRGRTIMIQWDEQMPRPYSRLNVVQGTRGIWAGFPNRAAIEGLSPSTHDWEMGEALDRYREMFDHPLYTDLSSKAEGGGHGGMDFIMLWRVVYCLRHGLPLDQDVYDAASWSVVGPLSEISVKNRGQSVDVPDFTRGRWETMTPLGVVKPETLP